VIKDREDGLPVARACAALGVSTSAYYAWLAREPSRREKDDLHLAVEVRAVHRESRQTYGARRIHAELRARGLACGRHRVARLMREQGLVARGPKHRPPKATPSTPLTPVAANVLDRAFEPAAPDRVWTADITHVATAEGWVYLAVVVDLFSRRVPPPTVVVRLGAAALAWTRTCSCRAHVCAAKPQAKGRFGTPPRPVATGGDQGSQYTSSDYRTLLRQREIVCSMSRRGNCHDNAPTESLFGSLKTECVRGERFQTHDEARAAIFDYLVFYNTRRRHSALGYLSPADYERQHQSRQVLMPAA
jgi:transposase InsO family protein